MKTSQRSGWIWIGVGICLLLAVFLSPFASSSPDGLNKVADMKGFQGKSDQAPLWNYAPLAGYGIPGITDRKRSTALSGALGTLAMFSIGLGVGKLLGRRHRGKEGS